MTSNAATSHASKVRRLRKAKCNLNVEKVEQKARTYLMQCALRDEEEVAADEEEEEDGVGVPGVEMGEA